MTKATFKETRTPQPPIMVAQPDKVVRTVVVEMTEDEAKAVRLILGKRIVGCNAGVTDTTPVYDAIASLGLEHDHSWDYRLVSPNNTSWKFFRHGS